MPSTHSLISENIHKIFYIIALLLLIFITE